MPNGRPKIWRSVDTSSEDDDDDRDGQDNHNDNEEDVFDEHLNIKLKNAWTLSSEAESEVFVDIWIKSAAFIFWFHSAL